MANDIVYVLKNDIKSDELIYSLRSVCENFKFRKIWFYGGCPDNVQPDNYVNFQQQGSDKWSKTRSMYVDIFNNDSITENFYLFNDDFYIMKPYEQDIPRTNGSLYMQVSRILKRNHGRQSNYTDRLYRTAQMLRSRHLDVISYETHTPFLINRNKGLTICTTFASHHIFRSTYGNFYNIGGILLPDIKIHEKDRIPDDNADVVSSTDRSFTQGDIGEYIRKQFPVPCRYEL